MDDINVINRPLKVCFFSLNAYPLFDKSQKGVQGGAELDTYMIATELARDNRFDVHFITGDYGQQDVTNFENVTIYKTVDLKLPVRSVLSIWQALKKADCDIYFKKGASLVTTLVALFCRIRHKPFVLRTAQDIECNGVYINRSWLRGRAFMWTLKLANAVFVQSDINKRHLEQTTGVSAVIVPNGHRISVQSEQNRSYILWVGRSASVKEPEKFINLAQETQTEQFVMICQRAGDDNTIIYGDLVAKAETVANLKFIERVPFHEIDDYFRQAKVLVNTSTTEGFPNTFIQACEYGTPILSLKVNPDDFLNRYRCGLCADGDWESFKNMLTRLLEQKALKYYGDNGRRYALENHDIIKIVEQYKAAFFQIMKCK
jgi:glycosyltransferase involved in cell wall biosynthesis